MDSDSDSDASHISSTPPRQPNPPPPTPPPRPPPPPPPPPLKSRVRVSSLPKPKRKPKPKPKLKPKSSPNLSSLDPSSLPSSSLPNPHAFSIKISRPSDPNGTSTSTSTSTSSFSRLVKSRRPSFDPSEFENCKDAGPCKDNYVEGGVIPTDTTDKVGEAVGVHARLKKIHPNSVGLDVPELKQIKRAKCRNEGNFVRLNINGYGRRYGYKNGKRKSSMSSRAWRRRSVAQRSRAETGTCGNEEDDLILEAQWEQNKKVNCSSKLVEEAVVASQKDPSEQNLTNLLKLTHGYDSFREGQMDAIKRVIGGESMMLVLPTGAGKSLCYQLPALILPGVTLVVSPLLALMVDQLKKLPPIIPGGLLSSNQTSEESCETLHRLHAGEIKVLFVSPERFLNADFLSVFDDALSISLVVIDEAHCISEWSHNFRPSYLRLRASLLRRRLNIQCVLAMTATATAQTLQDIMNALEIPPTNLIRTCQIRENLQLSISLSNNRLKDLLLLLKSSPFVSMRSIIVYCKFQAETDMVSKYLCDNNIPAKGYHSGIPSKSRSAIQELFCSNKIRVVVATVAFGMGLDKGDVEGVIHYSLPESLEEYVQETGRAGRDGRISYCHLLLDTKTYYKIRSLLYSDGVDEHVISKFLCQVFSNDVHLTGEVCSLIKESAARKFDLKEEVLLTVLTLLEIGDQQYLRLLPQLSVTCTLYFHKTTPALLSEKDILVAVILKNCRPDTKEGHYMFDIPTVANHLRITTIEVLNQLYNLKSLGEITYEVKDPAYCFVIMKKPDDFCALSVHLTKWLSGVETSKVQKLAAMFNLASFAAKDCKRIGGCSGSLHTPCIQRKIMDYFCKKHESLDDDFPTKIERSSPFLHADIKVFLQSNSSLKFTPRAVARIMYGISSPAFPSATWCRSHFWGRYVGIDFSTIMEAAKVELMNFIQKGGE
ncbi:ATP-dependent DNA helicase Q-like 5 [Typha angustifolia]|uniref:ATP-dependent DNA helicase Q-like 5 n=1 Tax=Typha angustifolia TaxID=59011 RepID=UPI003C2B8B03